MKHTATLDNPSHSSNLIKARPSADCFELIRVAIANGEYPTPATVDAAIDAILPIIVGGSGEVRDVA